MMGHNLVGNQWQRDFFFLFSKVIIEEEGRSFEDERINDEVGS